MNRVDLAGSDVMRCDPPPRAALGALARVLGVLPQPQGGVVHTIVSPLHLDAKRDELVPAG